MNIVNVTPTSKAYVINGIVFIDSIKYEPDNGNSFNNRISHYNDNIKNELRYAINNSKNTETNDDDILFLLKNKHTFTHNPTLFKYLLKEYGNNSVELSIAFADVKSNKCLIHLSYELSFNRIKYRNEVIEHILFNYDLVNLEPIVLDNIASIGNKKHINFIFNWLSNYRFNEQYNYLGLNIILANHYIKTDELIYLQYFINSDSPTIHKILLTTKNDKVLDLLANIDSVVVSKKLASIDNLNRLRMLVKHESKEVRGIVTRHNHEELLDILVKDSDSHVRYCLASNQYKNKKYLKKLIKDPNRRVREYSLSLYEDLELTWFERFRLSILKFNNVMHM